jgi:hypothetical protein
VNTETGSIFNEEDIEQMLSTCAEHGSRLTEWERGFVESLTDQFEEKTTISEKQLVTLEKIYAAKTP